MRRACVALGWLLAGTIVWLSVTPTPPKTYIEQGDKIEHFLAYGSLMFWFAQLYQQRSARLAYVAGWIAMGVALEFVQRWLGYRTFDTADMAANTIGVLIGWGLSSLSPRFLPR